MATEVAWLNGNRLMERRKRKCALTSTGLLMEGVSVSPSSRTLRSRRTYSKFARDNRGSTRLRVYVPSMLRNQPTMALEVCGAVLFFSIDGFVKLFPDRPALTFRFRVM